MTRRERLMATMNGEAVDRPAVSFYEIDGLNQDETLADPFNIYADPSWKRALELAREKTDRIVMTGVGFKGAPADPVADQPGGDKEPDGEASNNRSGSGGSAPQPCDGFIQQSAARRFAFAAQFADAGGQTGGETKLCAAGVRAIVAGTGECFFEVVVAFNKAEQGRLGMLWQLRVRNTGLVFAITSIHEGNIVMLLLLLLL